MIISPRAKEVTNVVRKEGSGFLKINEVLLFRRMGLGSPYRKITYWKRGQNSFDPPQPKLTSFAIVPDMTAAVYKGFSVHGDVFGTSTAVNAWQAFNRNVTYTVLPQANKSPFGAWTIVTFPEPRIIRGWALQFATSVTSAFTLHMEGRANNGSWMTMFQSSSVSPVNSGRYGATTPMQCTAVRIATSLPSTAVRSCQLFDALPLVPVTMTSNTLPSTAGVTLVPEPANGTTNTTLYQRFIQQSTAGTQGTIEWYYNGGAWRSNRGKPGSKDQNRFMIRFAEPKSVCGFSVGGLASYTAGYCYAKCLLIEGRESDSDFWRRLDEVEFEPAERRTRCFDFPLDCVAGQLRITVQDVVHGTNASGSTALYLPPMQVWGT